MAFQYTPFDASRYAGTIGELIARGGDIRARGAEQLGAIRAQQQAQNGQIWGGFAQNLGSIIGRVPGQIRDQREAQQEGQLRQQRVASGAIDLGEKQAIQRGNAVMDGDQLPAGDVGPRQQSYLTPEGLFDIPKLNQALADSGVGHLAPQLLAKAEQSNAAITSHIKGEQEQNDRKAIILGDIADSVLTLHKHGVPLEQAMDSASLSALATKRIDPQQYAQTKAQVLQMPPDQQIAALTNLRAHAERIAPTKVLSEGATETGRYGTPIAKGGEKPKTEAELAVDAAKGDATAQGAMSILKPTPKTTAEDDKRRYIDIQARLTQKQPVTVMEQAWAAAYEKNATLSVDKSASAAADRQANAIKEQTAQQKRSQDFQVLQTARADIQKNADTIYSTAHTAAETLRDTVAAAQAGNKFAASQQTLEGTMATLKSQGFSRLNATELGVSANAGSIWDRINGYLGKKLEGQPVPADMQKDMLAFADILDKAAYKKYSDAHDAVNKLYGTTIPRTFQPSAAPDGQNAAAPKENTEGVVNGVPAVWKTVNGKAGWYRK